jgi:hypothetical protein
MAVSWFGKTELEVGWHAPLFNASKFTDVALRLRLDETDGVQWDRIVLNHSGGCGLGPPPGRTYFRTLGSLENVHQQNFAWKSLHRKKNVIEETRRHQIENRVTYSVASNFV